MKKLSKAQQSIVEQVKNGLYAWTNEGEHLHAWLGDKSGKKVTSIRIDSLRSLVDNNVLVYTSGNYRNGIFKYSLK